MSEPERARTPWTRCKAVKEPNKSGYWGRCDLRRNHAGDHALERGMEIHRWSTAWSYPALIEACEYLLSVVEGNPAYPQNGPLTSACRRIRKNLP